MATKKASTNGTAPQTNINLVDVTIKAPEGVTPAELHIVLNRQAIEWAEQYKNMLFVSRGIPFSMSAVPISDPLAMVIASQSNLSGNAAVQQAISWYTQWAQDAERESYLLAIVANNEFTNEPTPYAPSPKPPPGIPFVPEPQRNLDNPTEKRLKQIMDYLGSSPTFESEAMSAINNAFAEAARFAVRDAAGFQPSGTSSSVPSEDVAVGGTE